MRVNLTLTFFVYLCGVVTWRIVSRRPKTQKAIHRAHLGMVLQWYALLFLGCVVMVIWTCCEFFVVYYSLDAEEVLDNLQAAYEIDPSDFPSIHEFLDRFAVPVWIQRLSMLSNLAGIPVITIAAVNIWKRLIYPGMQIVHASSDMEASKTPWWLAPGLDRLAIIMFAPVMFSVMSMRASCRVWALITGQADNVWHASWKKVEKWEVALYHMDEEVAQMFQFMGVYAFCRICGTFLDRSLGEVIREESNATLAELAMEFRRLIRYAGFLGVWAFVVLGVLRCFLEYLVEVSRYEEVLEDEASEQEKTIVLSANTAWSFLAILCVINMYIIGWSKTIKDYLGNANAKFMGTRMLLLIMAIQEQVADGLCGNSESYDKIVAKAKTVGLDISGMKLSLEQADLLHLSLLNFECLFVVIFNAIVWKDLDLDATGLALYGHPCTTSSSADGESSSDAEVCLTAPL